MSLINKNFQITESDIKKFQQDGFLLLKGVFSQEFISTVKNKIDNDISAPSDKYQSGFSRIAFDLFEGDETIASLMTDTHFRKVMNQLSGKELLYTQGLGFELKKNDSKGFPWHIGTQSFGYQQAEDFGCTIWTHLFLLIIMINKVEWLTFLNQKYLESSCTTISIPLCLK
ncbi:phytanoyl-CoA dioxygenase family protein [Vibrio campbellii]